MTRLTLILSVTFAALAASARMSDIEVGYVAHSPNFSNGEVDLTNRYILLANASESKFYSPATEYLDSLNSTPDGRAKVQQMTVSAVQAGDYDNIPKKDGLYYIVKSLQDNRLRYYDIAGLDKYYSEEPVEEIDWTITDLTKTVIGYECIMAVADFRGRKWIAWFAPDIPVINGPWKLGGLPGLILEASTDNGQYSFIATGIQSVKKPIGPIYLADRYEKIGRKDILKAKRAFLDNPLGQINAQMGNGGARDEDDNTVTEPMFVPASVVDFLETDYK